MHGIKDFLVHISIVTVGILIALGLEGLRESIHERHLVRETRENMSTEMTTMLAHATDECAPGKCLQPHSPGAGRFHA